MAHDRLKASGHIADPAGGDLAGLLHQFLLFDQPAKILLVDQTAGMRLHRALLQLQQRIAALPTAAAVQMDASALASLDTSAIAVMLECRRTALAAGRSFAVLGAPPTITSLARLYGVAGLLGI